MMKPGNHDYSSKSTVEEIRERFDKDVERFSNLDTGQQTTIDAPLTMELCTDAAKYATPHAKRLLDIGCGAGNYTLKMLSKIPGLDCALNDLSKPMLQRARERVSDATTGMVNMFQEDIRSLELGTEQFDIVLAAAVLHHLRDDDDWRLVFQKIYRALSPGGSVWISDLVTHDDPAIRRLFNDQYGDYLESLGGLSFRDKVLAYVEKEDTPRSVRYQLELLKEVGFRQVEVLHKHACFAAFGAIK